MPAPNLKGTEVLTTLGRNVGNAIGNTANYSAQAASRANGISFASQAAQGAFNQNSANIANALATDRIVQQMGYNTSSWQQAADWNERMFNMQMAFNAEEAQKQRDFLINMDSTKYQRAITDMEKAGLNPVLAVTGGGISTSGGGGAAASVSAPSMSGASSGLLNGINASEGNFSGQMEYMAGILGLISAVTNGFSSAFKGLGSLGDFGEGLGSALIEMLSPDKEGIKEFEDKMNSIGHKNPETGKMEPWIYKHTDKNGWYGNLNRKLKDFLGWSNYYE